MPEVACLVWESRSLLPSGFFASCPLSRPPFCRLLTTSRRLVTRSLGRAKRLCKCRGCNLRRGRGQQSSPQSEICSRWLRVGDDRESEVKFASKVLHGALHKKTPLRHQRERQTSPLST